MKGKDIEGNSVVTLKKKLKIEISDPISPLMNTY